MLHLCAETGHAALVAPLVAAGADIGARAWRGGAMALHLAAGKGYMTVVEALLEARADVSARSDGETPYQIAKEGRHTAVAELLRQKRCDE